MKTIYFLFILLSSILFTNKSTTPKINDFKPGTDSLASVYQKINNYSYIQSYERYNETILIDITVKNYSYNNMIGELELFTGDSILYYVKFTNNSNDSTYQYCDSVLFKKYIEYWDVDDTYWF
jgi:hypothetical protein